MGYTYRGFTIDPISGPAFGIFQDGRMIDAGDTEQSCMELIDQQLEVIHNAVIYSSTINQMFDQTFRNIPGYLANPKRPEPEPPNPYVAEYKQYCGEKIK